MKPSAAARKTTIELDRIPGGKKLIYTHKKLDLVALSDFETRGATDPFYADLARLLKKNNMLWSKEADDYLPARVPEIRIAAA
jgi:hypothetical protein